MSRGSRIVNVTSVSGRVPTPGEAFYSACKAAVVSLSEALEAELAGRGIGVTVVLPGEMSTALFAEHPSWERRPAFQRRMEIPPERVAEAIVRAVRLASDRDSVNYRHPHPQPGTVQPEGARSHGGTLREKDSEPTLAV